MTFIGLAIFRGQRAMLSSFKLTRNILITLFGGLIFGLIVVLSRIGINSPNYSQYKPHVFQKRENIYVETYPKIVLEDLWKEYKRIFIQSDGRTMDRSLNFLTTSEGQSYSLLRAVWMDDKKTFDSVLQWTNHNLKQRETDSLFAWKWGQLGDGTWGILESEGGMNSASDADQDIALALIFAYSRWNQPHYITQARALLDSIWESEVAIINGRPYLVAGNWAVTETDPTINPSYYSFAAYPIFARVDPSHDWMGLKDTSYEVLNKLANNLPPDWAVINATTEEVTPISLNGNPQAFSHDAIRIPWRVALDWDWHGDERAKDYLDTLGFFADEWRENNIIFSEYTLDRKPMVSEERISMYGALLPYLNIVDKKVAEEVYVKKISSQFDADMTGFGENVGYYSSNWGWFGLALYHGYTVNIFSEQGVLE